MLGHAEKPALPTFWVQTAVGRGQVAVITTPPGTPPAPGNLDHTDRINRDAVDGGCGAGHAAQERSPQMGCTTELDVLDHAAEVAGATAKSAENNVRNLGLGLDPMRNLNLPSKK